MYKVMAVLAVVCSILIVLLYSEKAKTATMQQQLLTVTACEAASSKRKEVLEDAHKRTQKSYIELEDLSKKDASGSIDNYLDSDIPADVKRMFIKASPNSK